MTKTWNDLAEIENLSTLPSNLLLVDGNNLAFRWIQRHNHNDFKEDFIRTVDSLAKSYRAKRTIVCFDFGRSYYRNELIDTYKANRKKTDDPETAKRYNEFFESYLVQFDDETLDYVKSQFENVLNHMNATQTSTINDFSEENSKLDNIRDENFSEIFPEMYNLLKDYYEH